MASRLRRAREQKGWNLQQLAEVAKIDKSILSRIEAGEREDLRLSTAVNLCRALGMSVDDLAGLDDGAPTRLQRELRDVSDILQQAAQRLRQLQDE